MSLVSTGLALLTLGAAAAVVVALLSSAVSRARLSAALTCLVGVGGVLAGVGDPSTTVQ